MSRRVPARPAGGGAQARTPIKPAQPRVLDLALLPDDDLQSDTERRKLSFADLDMSQRSAELAEFTQCRFENADLGGTTLDRVVFSDCVFDHSNLANLRATKSSLVRVELSVLRMTGFQWTDGRLRDVRFTDSRIDLSSFRFTNFVSVVFDRCNLTGVDFVNADLRGAEFSGCDLSGAQFSHAKMEGARFADCVLADIVGVTSWDGAIVRSHDLVTLSYTLAAALGIRIENDR
jgi:uncharacterized protein YjbI with pentapeptide repeats